MTETPLLSVSGSQGVIELYEDEVVIDRTEYDNVVTDLLGGSRKRKEIPISEITGVTVKDGGIVMEGYIHVHQRGHDGATESRWQALRDENSLMRANVSEFETFKEELEKRRAAEEE